MRKALQQIPGLASEILIRERYACAGSEQLCIS